MSLDDWRQRAWDALEQVQQQWRGTVGSRPSFDSTGRHLHGGFSRLQTQWDNTFSRVERVRSALNRSGPIAQGLITSRLAGIDLSTIWGILVEACKDIALYYGGSVVVGTAVGGPRDSSSEAQVPSLAPWRVLRPDRKSGFGCWVSWG